jgi:ABC-type antimicrobial peptide transport system permease subunit
MGRRYTSLMVALLAGIALLLSVVGVYAALSYFVRQHTRDIGIRIALGGGPEAALRMVVTQGMSVALVGTVVGLAGALVLTRFMTDLLYDVTATDPWVFLVVSSGTLLVAFGASAVPARTAAATDPAATLREE